jgi:monoterpene epsilon-lactone hydrolase
VNLEPLLCVASGVSQAVIATLTISLNTPRSATDKMLSGPLVEFFRESWLGGTGVAYNDPSVNLMYANLAGLPPINYYGAHEVLAGEIREFADRAKAASVDVSLHSVPGGQHLFLRGAGRVPETDAAIAEMGRWLHSKLAVTASTPSHPAVADSEVQNTN